MLFWGRFRTSSDIDREYLRNERHVIDSDFSRVRRKKSGELWYINNTVQQVDYDPPKSAFSEDHISAPRGCCRLKFLHALENDQGLPAHTPAGTGVPPTRGKTANVAANFVVGFALRVQSVSCGAGRVDDCSPGEWSPR